MNLETGENGGPDKDVIYFGRANFRNANRLFGIKRKDRRQHMYIIGKSGTGKSVLIENMVVQDIANGEGLCVVDPHGELIEHILAKVPVDRVKDVVYFNPADPDYAVGFNVLEIPDPRYKHLVAQGLMGIFTKIWSNVWSARMEYILNNSILALVDTPGSTLLGIPRLLVDKEYRQKVVSNIQDPVIKSFWVNEFEDWKDQYRMEAIAPIQNKVGQFLSTAIIRNIVGQSKSTIDIFDIMNTSKIFLVDVSKGRIGEDNSALLGAMIITKIQLAAMERVRVAEEERVDFYLYVDEFQNFATDSFANILSEARKYRLDLIIANQYVGQLVTDVSTKVRDAIFGNVGTAVVFRVGAADAEFLEPEFEPEFVIQDIVGLPNYHIYLKLMVEGVSSRPFSATTLPPFKVKTSDRVKEEITESSRKLYSRPRYVVEDEIRFWTGMGLTGGSSAPAEGRAERGQGYSGYATGRGRPGGGYVRREQPQDVADLSHLGIEFSPSEAGRGPAPVRASAPSPSVAQQRPPFRDSGPPRPQGPVPRPIESRPTENRESRPQERNRWERPPGFTPGRRQSIMQRDIPNATPAENGPVMPDRPSGPAAPAAPSISLRDLKPEERHTIQPKGEPNLDELRKALSSALENLKDKPGE